MRMIERSEITKMANKGAPLSSPSILLKAYVPTSHPETFIMRQKERFSRYSPRCASLRALLNVISGSARTQTLPEIWAGEEFHEPYELGAINLPKPFLTTADTDKKIAKVRRIES